MIGTQFRFLAAAVVVLLCATTAFSDPYIISATFKETRETKPGSYTMGTMYYLYDPSTPKNSRLSLIYSLPKGTSVTNLYHYTDAAMYSMCSSTTCTGINTTELPDPWYATSIYQKNAAVAGTNPVQYNFTRKSLPETAQVRSIVMTDSSAPTASGYTVSKVEFKDGRTLYLSNFKFSPSGVSSTSSQFKPISKCPKPTCPIYADIVFVLDYSGSVSSSEWGQLSQFVIGVLNSFTFGDDGAAAAALQFNGNGAKNCIRKTVGPKGNTCSRYYQDCEWSTNALPSTKTAKVIAPIPSGSNDVPTVTTDVQNLINVMSQSRTPSGQTCQGFGMELAHTVLSKSPRRKLEHKPHVIVIAVTDGVDFCPNRTAAGADKLRKDFNATVIEVGVGLSSCANNYDKNFLKSISSKLGTEPFYFDVANYGAIKQLADRLFKPVCEEYGSDCPSCDGFCGCGKCFCANCNEPSDTCKTTTCQERDGTSTGCVLTNKPCDFTDNVCQWAKCDGTKPDSQRCSIVNNTCSAMRQQYPGTCREVLCSTSVSGGCYVKLNDKYCKDYYGGDECVQYECTPLGQTVPSGYTKTGCRLVVNKTLNHQQELVNSGKSSCLEATCDANTGVVGEKDLCPGRNQYPKCYTSSCQKSGGEYKCINKDYKRPKDDECIKYKCETKGWVVKEETTDQNCEDHFEEQYAQEPDKLKCKTARCDAAKGCVLENITGCTEQCNEQWITDCIGIGAQKSEVDHCYHVLCDTHDVLGDGNYTPYCKDVDVEVNCLENQTIVKMIDDMNNDEGRDPTKCYKAACSNDNSDSYCTYEFEKRPEDLEDTKCMEYRCVRIEDGIWEWLYVPTELNVSCTNNSCVHRTCHKDEGCIVTKDVCVANSTECTKYTCEVNGDSYECIATNLLITTNCTKEECEDGKKVLKDTSKTTCELPDLCHYATCVYFEENHTSYCELHDVPPPGNDPCLVYTCDNETGRWNHTKKCDDGLYCTNDQCSVYGECRNNPIRCGEELNMTGYPCFEARCKEGEDKHKCVRKLIPNAYIDICGNCIKKDVVEVQSSSDSTSSSEVNELVQCTGAPPRPMLTEGLAAAAIALIIIAAVVGGAGIAASGVITTKTLIDRARGASNQSAHSNPLFEDNEAEMTNPAFVAANEGEN